MKVARRRVEAAEANDALEGTQLTQCDVHDRRFLSLCVKKNNFSETFRAVKVGHPPGIKSRASTRRGNTPVRPQALRRRGSRGSLMHFDAAAIAAPISEHVAQY